MKIAFLGAGNMGSALIAGAVRAKILKTSQVTAFDIKTEILAGLKKKTGVRTVKTVREAVDGADYIFLCVKPQQMGELLAEVRDCIVARQCLVSIAAGVRTEKIEKAFAPRSVSVVRVMPNTPALLGFGASAICGGKAAKPAQVKFVQKFFSAVGRTVTLPESAFDAVTAVSGSGPAYVFYLAEALAQAAASERLPAHEAAVLINQTILGAAQMLFGKDAPDELRKKVTSPGGTTEAAVQHLTDQKWREIFVEAVRKASERSRELSKI